MKLITFNFNGWCRLRGYVNWKSLNAEWLKPGYTERADARNSFVPILGSVLRKSECTRTDCLIESTFIKILFTRIINMNIQYIPEQKYPTRIYPPASVHNKNYAPTSMYWYEIFGVTSGIFLSFSYPANWAKSCIRYFIGKERKNEWRKSAGIRSEKCKNCYVNTLYRCVVSAGEKACERNTYKEREEKRNIHLKPVALARTQ